MKLFNKNKGKNRLLKLYKTVSQKEAELYDIKLLIEFLLIEFKILKLDLNNFYITGPYPNHGWKTENGFVNGLKIKNYKNIHHLIISDSENLMFLNFQNWSHNTTIEVESGSIAIELMFDEDLMNDQELVSFGKRIYKVFNFEYGYVFSQTKKFSISEGKIKNGFFSYSESENPKYQKWSKYQSAIKFGFIRTVFEYNFLSPKHLENKELNQIVHRIGHLKKMNYFSTWTLTSNEVNHALGKLRLSSVLVENDSFNLTETCRIIDNEIKKYSPQHPTINKSD